MSEDKPDSRNKKGQFKKGMSGNPGGRKSTPVEIKEMFKAAAPQAVADLIALSQNEKIKPETRLAAIKLILERALGRPAEEKSESGMTQADAINNLANALLEKKGNKED